MNKVNEERVHEIFNNISTDYDKMNAIISFKQHDLWRDKTMKKMGNLSGMTILDLCCGTGDWTFDLSKAVGQKGKVVGLDFSENMLKVAQTKLDKKDNSNIEFIQGNAMAIPFEKEMFDAVTIGYGLRNTPDYLTVLREIFRVLKPGGKVVCIETSHPTLPIYKQAFELYFKKVMPFLGKVFAKSLKEYQWLQKSAENFPDAKALALLFSKAGFSTVSYQKYGGGAIYNHYGISISGNLHAAKVYVHEFGHLFLGLGDEYVEVGSSYNDMYPTNVEPWEANLTTLTNFNKKWKDMLDKDTPVPTTYDPQNPKKLGAYEGGGYVSKGVYRPRYD